MDDDGTEKWGRLVSVPTRDLHRNVDQREQSVLAKGRYYKVVALRRVGMSSEAVAPLRQDLSNSRSSYSSQSSALHISTYVWAQAVQLQSYS